MHKMENSQNSGHSPLQRQTVIINAPEHKSNGTGTAGFVLALIALFLGWIPVLGWIVWLLGLILSCAGLFKEPKGLAIAGFVISLVDLLLLIAVFGALAGLAGLRV